MRTNLTGKYTSGPKLWDLVVNSRDIKDPAAKDNKVWIKGTVNTAECAGKTVFVYCDCFQLNLSNIYAGSQIEFSFKS